MKCGCRCFSGKTEMANDGMNGTEMKRVMCVSKNICFKLKMCFDLLISKYIPLKELPDIPLTSDSRGL